ncbi:MAG: DNA-directed RNA polymerase subunit beta [Alphaproteobacteria bacterium MarineAlpha6_Bin3]|nr:MAG: DNA-directed RNA polymerase subunit beta [Alphaproteobacteria bacterium MarineAlpha6_Bin3]|tara:strand:+ start:582 stop:4712 length:4131 start_codon:yes stop_codon:yes gene_type:complete
MDTNLLARKRFRKRFGNIPEILDIPNLIEVQKNSYEEFLQRFVEPNKREDIGLQQVLKEIFPINDYAGKATLEFIKYHLETPKYDVDECKQRGFTYASSLKVTLRILRYEIDEENPDERSFRDSVDDEVYLGDIPLMTDRGTFVFNGIERVVVSQMHRSPGVFFDHDNGKGHPSGKLLYSARIIPMRGSWIDFEFDVKDIMYVRIDRKKKMLASTFFMALEKEQDNKEKKAKPQSRSPQDILNYFYSSIELSVTEKGWTTSFDETFFKGKRITFDLVDSKNKTVKQKSGSKLSLEEAKKLKQEGLNELFLSDETIIGKYLAEDIINEKTGEIFFEAGDEITEKDLSSLKEKNIKIIKILDIDHVNIGAALRNTVHTDLNLNREESLIDIYKNLRPGEPPTLQAAENLFQNYFFNAEKYDLSKVGRYKLNSRSELNINEDSNILTPNDILEIAKHLLFLNDTKGKKDDIDHLGNRRVRSVGELIENQYRIGLVRMERAIKERMSSIDIFTATAQDLINSKPAVSILREFFGTSQLSQFMDQTNPLSEITHKRRVSSLGPGGLTRERAGFEVRDVHPTHYGRICPVETPEGPNIGLINSLATYSKINNYGLIESPYRKVENQKVTEEIVFLAADEEQKFTIAQANTRIDENGKIVDQLVSARQGGEFLIANPSKIDFMDVSPKQLVSVASALIPFLENDDANRALMGSNMMRQAVPLLRPDAPFVGTGMEESVGKDSGVTVVAKRGGNVNSVDSGRIVVSATNPSQNQSGVDIYNLKKFQRSNQSTCINQVPLVKKGDLIKAGEIIADGPATSKGELALGKNILVAFMPWQGYNFEDAIIMSEQVVRGDKFTSVHIEEHEIMARDTKLGQEEITRDIPNVGDEALKNLDEAGIIYIGAEVKAGDILVGKITPKAHSTVSPEEKLLRSIFGEKSTDVSDTSLRVPPGESGTVVEVRVFNRRGVEKDERSLAIERSEIEILAKDRDDERTILEESFSQILEKQLVDNMVLKGVKNLKKNQKITSNDIKDLPVKDLRKIILKDKKQQDVIQNLNKNFDNDLKDLENRFQEKVEKLQLGDELPPGVMRKAVVYVAVKRKLQAGDKMAGRHGNKGCISKIVPVEDMPHLEDGRPIDILLNPLGVPSRMNVGQILETHLGWACAGLGKKISGLINAYLKNNEKKELEENLANLYEAKNVEKIINNKKELIDYQAEIKNGISISTPVFDGAKESDINNFFEKSNLSTSGQVKLQDGRTGEHFDREITVGYIYMLKLHHLADEKLHARSIGPYSLVTQQPLGGKAQFGGQRVGEMEVWALEAYGASYCLQEMLTVKSDDVAGRTKVYEAIVRGQSDFQSGIPESFNVLVKELRSLALDVQLKNAEV